MPAPPRPNPPGHVVRLAVGGGMSGVNWVNVFWIRNGNGQTPDVNDLNALVDDVLAEYQSAFLGHVHVQVTLTEGDAIYYGPTGGDVGSTRPFTGAGSGGGSILPNNVAQVVSWQIQQRYKGGHPRTYLPAPGAGALQDSRLFLASQATLVTTAANQFHSHINAASHGALSDLHLGTVSFVHAKQWRTPPVFRDYTLGGAHMDQRVDSMRTRLGPDVI